MLSLSSAESVRIFGKIVLSMFTTFKLAVKPRTPLATDKHDYEVSHVCTSGTCIHDVSHFL